MRLELIISGEIFVMYVKEIIELTRYVYYLTCLLINVMWLRNGSNKVYFVNLYLNKNILRYISVV